MSFRRLKKGGKIKDKGSKKGFERVVIMKDGVGEKGEEKKEDVEHTQSGRRGVQTV